MRVPDHLVKFQVREWLPKLLCHRQSKIYFIPPAWSFALPPEKTTHLLNESSIAKQIDGNLFLSDINININRFAYNKYLAPRKRVCAGSRVSRNKCINGTTRRHLILYNLAQVIVSDKDIVLAQFYHQAHKSNKKQFISTIAYKILIISYCILKKNNFHHKFVFNSNELRVATPLSLEPYYGYRLGPLIINCCISICSMAGLTLILHTPLVFPSLGPTVFLPFYKPSDPSSSPRNIVIGHTFATIIGYLSLLITGLTAAGPVLAVGVTLPRIIAIGLSLGLTVALMVLLRASHPPALATTLMISLGILTKPWQLLVFILAVVLLTLQILIINRLAGIDYPLWHSQPTRTA